MDNYQNLTDEQLVALVAKNNQMIYAEIIKRYQKPLLRYAANLVGSEDEAADIVQEAFIKAYINLNSFDANKKFSTWIYRIVHNEAVNFLNKNKRLAHLKEEEWDMVEDHTESLDDAVFKAQLKQQVDNCLKKLPLQYKTMIILYFLEERSYEEISDILRVPIGTVGTNISRGKKQLQQVFIKKGLYGKN